MTIACVLRRGAGTDLRRRILAKVVVDEATGYWLWTASVRKCDGYGEIRLGGRSGRTKLAHRVSYEAHVGGIPDGLELDHLCG